MEEELPQGISETLRGDVERVNGFAPGDLFAIVNCEMAGAYGKVFTSRIGCIPDEYRMELPRKVDWGLCGLCGLVQ
jgi:hypothetical protein